MFHFEAAHYTANAALVHHQKDPNIYQTWLHLYMILNTKLLGWSFKKNTFMWEMRVEILPCRHTEDQSLCIPQAQRTDSKPSFVSVFAGRPMNVWGHGGVCQGPRQQISVPRDEQWGARQRCIWENSSGPRNESPRWIWETKQKPKSSEISQKTQRTKRQSLAVCVFSKVSDAQNTKSLSCDYNEVFLKDDLLTVLLHEELLIPVRERQR